MPISPRVKTSSAPNARRRTRLSIDIVSGMVRMSRYPLEAAMNASPMPVFPDVASTSVVRPGLMVPSISAWSSIRLAIRSFTLPHGLSPSSLHAIRALQSLEILFRYTIGVPPTSSDACGTSFSGKLVAAKTEVAAAVLVLAGCVLLCWWWCWLCCLFCCIFVGRGAWLAEAALT